MKENTRNTIIFGLLFFAAIFTVFAVTCQIIEIREKQLNESKAFSIMCDGKGNYGVMESWGTVTFIGARKDAEGYADVAKKYSVKAFQKANFERQIKWKECE